MGDAQSTSLTASTYSLDHAALFNIRGSATTNAILFSVFKFCRRCANWAKHLRQACPVDILAEAAPDPACVL